jgi:hypothetical protein
VECRVRWFDKITGEGIVDFEGVNIPVYGCNILGAKTGYPHTACMDLVAGQTVTGELYDFGSHVSLIKVSGGIFDHEKWNKIKDQNLAFRKNADGEFTNGLFSNQIKSEIT